VRTFSTQLKYLLFKTCCRRIIPGLYRLYFPQIFGVGYPPIEQTLNGQLGPMLVLGLIALKIIAHHLLWDQGDQVVFLLTVLEQCYEVSAHASSVSGILVSPAPTPCGRLQYLQEPHKAPISAILILFEMTGDINNSAIKCRLCYLYSCS